MKLNYQEQGNGYPVILIHGMFGSLSNLGNLARCLSNQFRVISVDLRNHGDSPHDSVFDMATMAEDILYLMDILSLPTAFIVGHSLGGKVGMQLALSHADRVNKLVVADISPVTYQPRNDPALNGLIALSEAIIQNRNQAEELLADFISDSQTRAFLLKNLKRNDDRFVLRLNINAVIENYGTALVAAPSGDRFDNPCLFIKGETSAYIQEKHRPIIKDMFPNSQVNVISGAGHWLHSEKPKLFNNQVMEFFTTN
ncbi:MAG: alpha/beta fold hydrolase [Porticoccaceae bacterium]|nr:alpha/beta fold hydrolase [Porticoccaceae bacterium]